jgi:phosphoglucosamine mutase
MNTLFGTDGIRSKVGIYPFTKENLPHLGMAIARWAREKYGQECAILLAHDTRQSCSWLKATLKSGLLTYPITLYDAHILPTPAVLHLMNKNTEYKCGIIISASHNPYYDNGIKLIDARTGKLSEEDEKRITDLLKAPTLTEYTQLGSEAPVSQAEDLYVTSITSLFKPDFLKGRTIVLDTAHGATYRVAPRIFEQLGATAIVLHNEPTGYNINEHSGTLHPQALQKAVVEYKAHIGFAFDGDGDRVLAVNQHGELKDGDDILALLSAHPDYIHLRTIVGTIMSNQALETHLRSQEKTLIRTPVGDKHVLEALHIQNGLLGGEQSGHIILKNILNTGDGILVALKLLEALKSAHNLDMVTFQKYPQVIVNIPVKEKKDLKQSPFAELIANYGKELQAGRLIVRYSGTENKLRIMVEDQDEAVTKRIAHNLAHLLEKMLN